MYDATHLKSAIAVGKLYEEQMQNISQYKKQWPAKAIQIEQVLINISRVLQAETDFFKSNLFIIGPADSQFFVALKSGSMPLSGGSKENGFEIRFQLTFTGQVESFYFPHSVDDQRVNYINLRTYSQPDDILDDDVVDDVTNAMVNIVKSSVYFN